MKLLVYKIKDTYLGAFYFLLFLKKEKLKNELLLNYNLIIKY